MKYCFMPGNSGGDDRDDPPGTGKVKRSKKRNK
jgi:hypothetical protein